MDTLFLEVHIHIDLSELPRYLDNIEGVSGESADRFYDNHVNLALVADIQRWENNKWVTVCKSDQIAKDRFFHSGSYYSPTGLPTGYYYRATMQHYAKEQGRFFSSSQKFYNETTIILLQ